MTTMETSSLATSRGGECIRSSKGYLTINSVWWLYEKLRLPFTYFIVYWPNFELAQSDSPVHNICPKLQATLV
jgi:hypothetical protein